MDDHTVKTLRADDRQANAKAVIFSTFLLISIDASVLALLEASHILPVSGAWGALAALVTRGIVYALHDDSKDYFLNDEFRWQLCGGWGCAPPGETTELLPICRAMGPVKPCFC